MKKTMISEETTIKLVKELDITELGGEKVMIDFSSGKYFMLKGVANDIWEYIKEPITIREIKDKLMSEYDVEESTCLDSIFKFVKQLDENAFIEVTETV